MKLVLALSVCLAATTIQRPAAPGQLVDIGGDRRLHVLCTGSGDGPSVIVEAGLSQYTAFRSTSLRSWLTPSVG